MIEPGSSISPGIEVSPISQAEAGAAEEYPIREQGSRRELPVRPFQGETVAEALERLAAQAYLRHLRSLTAQTAGPDWRLMAEVVLKRDNILCTLTFGGPHPSHQPLAVAFFKVLARDKKPWSARAIVKEFQDLPLRDLAARALALYVEQSRLPKEEVRAAFEPLLKRLELPVAAVLVHWRAELAYHGPTNLVVGDTRLADYFGADPEANIASWKYSVKRRVVGEIDRQDLWEYFEP
jgi:hypothetical protein